MAVPDGYGRLLVYRTLQQVKTSEITRKMKQAFQVAPQSILLVACSDTAAFVIDIPAYTLKPLLGRFDRIKIYTCREGSSAHVIHTALNMPILPSCSCIAESVVKTIEFMHTEQCVCRFLAIRLQYDCYFHIVIYHSMRHTMYVIPYIGWGLFAVDMAMCLSE